MGDRQTAIRPAHKKTFEWIFQEDSAARFVQWLKSDEKVYWVSGKPGSGKSTLMRFLCDHERTRACLQEWAADCKLAVASFFFWVPGRASLQKSQEGLLRSILYQILRQRPELLPLAAPKLWQSYIHGNTVSHGVENPFRNVPELLTALQRISAVMTASKIKFCFFIDGLDEYEGKPDDIIRLIEILKGLPEVKV